MYWIEKKTFLTQESYQATEIGNISISIKPSPSSQGGFDIYFSFGERSIDVIHCDSIVQGKFIAESWLKNLRTQIDLWLASEEITEKEKS